MYRTPVTHGYHLAKVKDEKLKISNKKHAIYQSAVGMLLFLLKHSRFCLANPLRELAKALHGPNKAAFKELKRVIEFMLDTKNYGLKIKPKYENVDEPWFLIVFCGSNYSGDQDTQSSVTGFCVFLMGVPISWKSRAQRSVTLSSSEAEFVALSEPAREIKLASVHWNHCQVASDC